MPAEIIRCATLAETSLKAADFIVKAAQKAVEQRGRFTFVLTGGTTPVQLYENLAASPHAKQMPWDTTHVFWGDERWVDASDPASNFAMGFNTLLANVPIPFGNIHSMAMDYETAAAGAQEYEKKLRQFFAITDRNNGPASIPQFDLVLLGMGTDGHIASLFPGRKELEISDRLVIPVEHAGSTPPVPRISLTLPVLNNASCVLFLVSGPGKLAIVEEILANPAAAYPAARVRPRGRTAWFLAEQ